MRRCCRGGQWRGCRAVTGERLAGQTYPPDDGVTLRVSRKPNASGSSGGPVEPPQDPADQRVLRVSGTLERPGRLSGVLFGIDRAVLFLADALSRVVACIGLLFMRSDLQNQRTTPPESLWRATGAGLRWVWRHSLIQVPPPLHAQNRYRRSQLDPGRASAPVRFRPQSSADRRPRLRLPAHRCRTGRLRLRAGRGDVGYRGDRHRQPGRPACPTTPASDGRRANSHMRGKPCLQTSTIAQ